LNKKSAQKQKDSETTASRKPLFRQKVLITKTPNKQNQGGGHPPPPQPKTSKTLTKSPAARRVFHILSSTNFLFKWTVFDI